MTHGLSTRIMNRGKTLLESTLPMHLALQLASQTVEVQLWNWVMQMSYLGLMASELDLLGELFVNQVVK